MPVALALASLVGLGLPGCGDEPDDLDADVVNRLTRTQGNASGFELSGDYLLDIEALDCTQCPQTLLLPQINMCSILGPLAGSAFGPGSGDSMSVTTTGTIVQSDGTILLRVLETAATGPIDSDGNFAVGRVADLTTAISEGDLVARVDGFFDLQAEEPTIDAVMRQRVTGHVQEAEFDCVQTFSVKSSGLP